MFEDGETVEFGGKIISHMASNPNIMKHSCRIVSGADYANNHEITDIDGKKMTSTRAFNVMGKYMVPNFLHFCIGFEIIFIFYFEINFNDIYDVYMNKI